MPESVTSVELTGCRDPGKPFLLQNENSRNPEGTGLCQLQGGTALKCPWCEHLDNKVIDSRLNKEATITRRRRECLSCGRRFTTYERLEVMLPMLIKKDGRRETWDRQKLVSGLEKACQKRDVSRDVIDSFVDRIEHKLQDYGAREIPSKVIGEWVMEGLPELDEVAYVRFASVYRQFKDVNEFMAELKTLLDAREL